MAQDAFSLPGFQVGHWTHPSGATGCSVILCERGALALAEVRGGAPGTRELAALGGGRLVQRADAVLLTGGSAFGLDAAGGVMRRLREQGRGFATRSIPVPIVAGAVIFDLVGENPPWPDAEAGYAAAASAEAVGWRSGRFGAGAGATYGKLGGNPAPGGIGVARVELPTGELAALVVVNAVGEVVHPDTGRPARQAPGDGAGAVSPAAGESTTIGVVATTVPVDRIALHRLAIAAHDGLARAIRPAHTILDGDTIFVLALHEGRPEPSDLLALHMACEDVTSRAVLNAVSSPGGETVRATTPGDAFPC